jgi:hypothetical protein
MQAAKLHDIGVESTQCDISNRKQMNIKYKQYSYVNYFTQLQKPRRKKTDLQLGM